MEIHPSRGKLANRLRKGLTLIEVVIALFIMALVILGAFTGLIQGIDLAKYSKQTAEATTLANLALTGIRSKEAGELPTLDAADATIVYDATGTMLTPDGGEWAALGADISTALTAQTIRDRDDYYILLRIEEDTVNTGLYEIEIEVLWSGDDSTSLTTASQVLGNYDSLSKRGITTLVSEGGFNGARF